MAARLIFQLKVHDHITDARRELYWLPVNVRILFSILVEVYKCTFNQAPLYLKELIQTSQPQRRTRSSSELFLEYTGAIPKTEYGERAFCNFAPKAWNNLPSYLRSCETLYEFRKLLKTYLFKKAFLL